MPRPREGERILACLKEYTDPVRLNPADDRPLTIPALIAVYKRPKSRTTWYKYGVEEVLAEVRRTRDLARGTLGGRPTKGRRRDQKLVAARQDARHWEQMYREILARYTVVERHFQRNKYMGDLDAIIRAGLEKPDRGTPL